MDSALYNRDILRLASSLVAGDRLDSPDGSAERRSPVCGSRIQADVNIAGNGSISGLALRANACALGQASAAIVRANAADTRISVIGEIRAGVELALKSGAPMPSIWPDLALLTPAKGYPSRHAAILLPYDAVLAAAAKLTEVENARD
jgi:NifU-like protein involved in Fe-S cluster formation